MLIADAKDPKDAHATGAEGLTTCFTQDQDILFMLYIVFLLFLPFMLSVLYDIHRTEDPISREDAHPLYPRYPRVLNYMLLFTAHSPTNLCEKGWGYHCCVLVRLLALLLN